MVAESHVCYVTVVRIKAVKEWGWFEHVDNTNNENVKREGSDPHSLDLPQYLYAKL